MFQVERLRVVNQTLIQIENELEAGNVDDPEEEKMLVQNIDVVITDLRHWLNTMGGGNE